MGGNIKNFKILILSMFIMIASSLLVNSANIGKEKGVNTDSSSNENLAAPRCSYIKGICQISKF